MTITYTVKVLISRKYCKTETLPLKLRPYGAIQMCILLLLLLLLLPVTCVLWNRAFLMTLNDLEGQLPTVSHFVGDLHQ